MQGIIDTDDKSLINVCDVDTRYGQISASRHRYALPYKTTEPCFLPVLKFPRKSSFVYRFSRICMFQTNVFLFFSIKENDDFQLSNFVSLLNSFQTTIGCFFWTTLKFYKGFISKLFFIQSYKALQ